MTVTINTISCLIIFTFCAWTVLDKRVHTKVAGTTILSCVGVAALLNISRPDYFGLLPFHYTTGLNLFMAIAAIWFWIKWKAPEIEELNEWTITKW